MSSFRARPRTSSRAFYSKAFGWEFTDYGPTYSATANGTTDVACRAIRPTRSAPLPVIRVDDLEAAFDSVTKAGGTIAKPIFSFPGGRRFHFIDPAGASLRCGARPDAPCACAHGCEATRSATESTRGSESR